MHNVNNISSVKYDDCSFLIRFIFRSTNFSQYKYRYIIRKRSARPVRQASLLSELTVRSCERLTNAVCFKLDHTDKNYNKAICFTDWQFRTKFILFHQVIVTYLMKSVKILALTLCKIVEIYFPCTYLNMLQYLNRKIVILQSSHTYNMENLISSLNTFRNNHYYFAPCSPTTSHLHNTREV